MSIFSQTAPSMPAAGQTAPDFKGNDVQGRVRNLLQWRGNPVVLFFFCGCDICREVATRWGQIQSSGMLQVNRTPPTKPSDRAMNGRQPIEPSMKAVTVVVFAGGARDAEAMASASRLDSKTTVLIPDLDGSITDDIYHVDECPRVFAIDRLQKIRYVNVLREDAPKPGVASVITTRILTALQSMT